MTGHATIPGAIEDMVMLIPAINGTTTVAGRHTVDATSAEVGGRQSGTTIVGTTNGVVTTLRPSGAGTEKIETGTTGRTTTETIGTVVRATTATGTGGPGTMATDGAPVATRTMTAKSAVGIASGVRRRVRRHCTTDRGGTSAK